MKLPFYKKALPHVVAVVTFLIVAIVYCKPSLEGKVLSQSDVTHWKGMAQQSIEYNKREGHYPLWNTNLFSGMPNYQIAMEGKSFLPNFTGVLSLGLPKPISFFFLACISFYILSMCLEINFLIAILGSLAFAYSTYDPVIISVGHETKMLAIAYMPGLLGGLYLLYERKYIIGFTMTCFFATMEVMSSHPQISYYFLICAGIMTIAYLAEWIKNKEWKHLAIALGLALTGGMIGAANTAISLMTTYEYTKLTIRGGKNIDIEGQNIRKVDTKGLDQDYAFSYSFGKSEGLTFLMPYAFGGSSGEVIGDDQRFVEALVNKNIPEQSAIQLANSLPKYWGGIEPSTAGPVYFGTLTCLLALIALVITKRNIKWWLLSALVVTLLMSWGKYFPAFNTFVFNNLPMYNRFRAPSMALVIPQLVTPILAVLALQQLFFSPNAKDELKKSFRKIIYVFGGMFVLIGIFYLINDYSSSIDGEVLRAYTDPQTGDNGPARIVINALKDSRKAMLGSGIIRLLFFSGILIGSLFLYIRNVLKPLTIIILLLVTNTIDLLSVANHYLNSDNYSDPDTFQADNFAPSPANIEILKDTSPHYRVYNLAPDRFNDAITSYFHRSVGGYHAAKLRIYQDLIAAQLSKTPLNFAVLNMLDTRYLIMPANQTQPVPSVHKNDQALGPAWFVKAVRYVKGPVEEMKALDEFDPKDTAIVDDNYRALVGINPKVDSAATIALIKYDNDHIKYSTSSRSDQFAVFSEIYYPKGWDTYIDGLKSNYVKVNYVLRGMKVPAGKHTIEFKFEPGSFYAGQKIVYAGNILLWLSILGCIFYYIRKEKLRPAALSK